MFVVKKKLAHSQKHSYETQDFWIIFTCSLHKTLKRILHKNYGHVRLLTCDKYNWIIIDPEFASINIHILACDIKEDVPNFIKQQEQVTDVIHLKVVQHTDFKIKFNFCLINCVSMCKYFLRIRNIFVQTPQQLHRYLKKKGEKL